MTDLISFDTLFCMQNDISLCDASSFLPKPTCGTTTTTAAASTDKAPSSSTIAAHWLKQNGGTGKNLDVLRERLNQLGILPFDQKDDDKVGLLLFLLLYE